MRKAALFSLIMFALPPAAAARPAVARPPVVIELYTAQGCTSCGDANAYVAKLAERRDVLALTFSVDYWDYLGWKDTFAQPEFADRQKAYVARLSLREPYTPQVVVDGRAEAAGLRGERVETLLREAGRSPRNSPDFRFVGPRRVDVGSGRSPKGGAEVWLIRYDPREQDVTVKGGDNRGKTIVHRNVVHELTRLGAWRGRPIAFRLPAASDDGLKTVIVLQAGRGGRIIGVGQPAR